MLPFSPIPHALWQLSGSEVCLFVKDKEGEGQKEARARLSGAASAGVTKVIGFSQLKANYKAHESRRRLCSSFDLFLSDDRVLPYLPGLLGKTFFKKKKQPVPVDLAKSKDWEASIARATGATYLFMGGGGCSAIRVGRCRQSVDEIAANAVAAAAGAARILPGGWANVRAMYLKTSNSVALPVYADAPSASDVDPAAAAAEQAAADAARAEPAETGGSGAKPAARGKKGGKKVVEVAGAAAPATNAAADGAEPAGTPAAKPAAKPAKGKAKAAAPTQAPQAKAAHPAEAKAKASAPTKEKAVHPAKVKVAAPVAASPAAAAKRKPAAAAGVATPKRAKKA